MTTAFREREAAALAHFAALLGFVFPLGNVAGPLAVLFLAGGRSDLVAAHARISALWQGAASIAAGTVLVAGPLHGFDPGYHMLVILAAAAVSLAAGLFTACKGIISSGNQEIRKSD